MQHSSNTLPVEWQVPLALRARLGDGPGRQRAMAHDGHLLIVLHDVPAKRQRTRNGQFFWRQPDGTWMSTIEGEATQAFDVLLNGYSAVIQRLTTLFETADESSDYFELQVELSPIVRSSRNLHAALADARNMCSEDRLLINARDDAYELMRSVELLHDDAESALAFDIARQTEAEALASHQMAVSSHRLNVLAAFFFPLATLSAFFGTNLTNGIERWDKAHPAILLAIMLGMALLIGVILCYFITRPAKIPDLKPMVKKK